MLRPMHVLELLLLAALCWVCGCAQSPSTQQSVLSAGRASLANRADKPPMVFTLPTEPTGAGAPAVDSCIWFADDNSIQQVQTSTHQVTRVIPLKNPQRLIMNAADCGVWALDKKERTILRYRADGTLESAINVRSLDPKINEAEHLRIDPYDESLWVADNQRIYRLTTAGQMLASFSAPGPVQRIQLALDRSLWVLGKRDLWRFDAKGTLLASYPLGSHVSGDGLYFEIDTLGGVIWLADNKTLAQLRLANPAVPPLRITLKRNVTGLTLDPLSGNVWVAQQEALLAYSRTGTLVYSVDLESKDLRKPEKLAFDPVSRSLWAGTQRSVSRFTDTGAFVGRYAAKDGDEALGTPAFKMEPTLTLVRPSQNALSSSAQPLFALSYGAACNGTACMVANDYFAGYQLTATLNGLAVGSQFAFDANSGQSSFTPATRLPEGANTFSAQVKDRWGLLSNTLTNTFTVDTVAPRFVTVTPLDGAAIPTPQTMLQGSIDDPKATVVLDGTGLNQTGPNFSFPVVLQPGANLFTLTAIDQAGNRASVSRTLVRGGLAINITSPAAGASITGSSALVTGTVDGSSNIGVTVNGVAASIAGSQFYATVPLQTGVNELLVRAATLDGASVQRTISVNSTGAAAVEVVADTASGVAPFKTGFTVNSAATIQSVQADFDGNGTIDFTTADPAAPLTFTYSQPGVYSARFVVTTLNNGVRNEITRIVPIVVLDAAALDQQLKALWQGFAGALAARNKVQAMQHLTAPARERYGPVFDALISNMPQILGGFAPIQLSSLDSGVGEYGVKRTNAAGVTYLYLIYFLQDGDGVWRLDTF